MTTYGKRRNGLLSSFSVFQDDKPEQDPNQHPSGKNTFVFALPISLSNLLAYARLGSVKMAFARTRSRAKLETESGDDDDQSNEQFSSIHNYTATVIHSKPAKYNKTMVEDFDKPLPPEPQENAANGKPRQSRWATFRCVSLLIAPFHEALRYEASIAILRRQITPESYQRAGSNRGCVLGLLLVSKIPTCKHEAGLDSPRTIYLPQF